MIKKSNKGMTIVEVTFVMPILIFVIISVVFLFLDIINDAVVQGESYCGIYAISIGDNEERIKDKIISSLENELVGSGNTPEISLKVMSGELETYIRTRYISGGNIYRYMGENTSYKREYDKCTQRLRRWQLYGDVLWE
ncbi:MAG: hypothetical protein J6P57_01770 [Lachnospiraceae bacterium]|nr:hypothetical protein [Lachnospiraceae bacterium]